MASMDKFMITNWCGVPHKFVRNADGSVAVDRFREVAESGINLVVAYDYGYKTNCEMLAACHEIGLRVTLCDERIDKALALMAKAIHLTGKKNFLEIKATHNILRKGHVEQFLQKIAHSFENLARDAETWELGSCLYLQELLVANETEIHNKTNVEGTDCLEGLSEEKRKIVREIADIHHGTAKYVDAVDLLHEVVRDYSGYPALLGYHIVDEPNSGAFPALAEIREMLSELDPVHESYFNLFPNYATKEMLGNPTYYDHLYEFVTKVKPEILSYDHYHFIKGKPMEQVKFEDERQNQIFAAAFQKVERAGFFDNIEDAKAVSEQTGVPFMVIILVTEHGPYRNLTEAEIRWEVFQSLCYGAKRISYFTYWTPGVDRDEGDDFWHWKNGMIAQDGTRNAHYHMVARINRELQAMGDILLPHKVQEVLHVGNEPDKKVRYWQGSHGAVTALEASRLTVGFFECGYVLLASKDYETTQTVRFAVEDGRTVSRYNKASGIWQTAELTDGFVTLDLAAGDGELFRIV